MSQYRDTMERAERPEKPSRPDVVIRSRSLKAELKVLNSRPYGCNSEQSPAVNQRPSRPKTTDSNQTDQTNRTLLRVRGALLAASQGEVQTGAIVLTVTPT